MTFLVNSVQILPVKNGFQTITLPDSKRGVYVQCNTSKEKVDEYMSNKNKIEHNAGIKETISLIVGTGLGLGLSAFKMRGDLVERLVVGGGTGFMFGMLGALCFHALSEEKIQKLNDEFIAKNAQ